MRKAKTRKYDTTTVAEEIGSYEIGGAGGISKIKHQVKGKNVRGL